MAGRISLIQTVGVALLGPLFLTFCENVAAQPPKPEAVTIPANLLPDSPVTAEQVAEGWIGLFDGRSLFGWRAESTANWRVEEGELIADGGEPGLLRTASQFDDFELLVEYTCDEQTDSGVFLRTSPRPGSEDAYEINLSGNDDWQSTGSINGQPSELKVPVDTRGFHELRIRARGGVIDVQLNGKTINRLEKAARFVRRGYIGLQYHSGGVRFRRVLLKPLFADRDVLPANGSSWTASTGNSFQMSVAENGSLQLNGGPGFVESEARFANLVLQMKCSISAGGNSGVFYRCIPGENTNGYESQIDNGMTGNDPAQPSNCGTGGIFRRKHARRIVAEDEQWFAKTIVAEGPHVAVWVNGFQVTDWSDKRAPNANPRRGLRMEAGTLMLQGHDDQTTVRFREIRGRELLDRR